MVLSTGIYSKSLPKPAGFDHACSASEPQWASLSRKHAREDNQRLHKVWKKREGFWSRNQEYERLHGTNKCASNLSRENDVFSISLLSLSPTIAIPIFTILSDISTSSNLSTLSTLRTLRALSTEYEQDE
jgi:hypothetical protein